MNLSEHEGGRRRQPMKFRSEIADECEVLRSKRDRASTDALLDQLRRHHDFNMPLPPKEEAKPKKPVKKVVVAPQPAPDAAPAPETTTIADIRRAVCTYFEMSLEQLNSRSREQKVVYPRQVAFFLAKTLTKASLKGISRQCGGRDHTTVLHGIVKIDKQVRVDWRVAYDVAAVESYL